MMLWRMRSSLGSAESSVSLLKPSTSARRARSQLEKAYPSIVNVGVERDVWCAWPQLWCELAHAQKDP